MSKSRKPRGGEPHAQRGVSAEDRDLFLQAVGVADSHPAGHGAHQRANQRTLETGAVTPHYSAAPRTATASTGFEPPTPVTLQISGDPTSFVMRGPGVSHQEFDSARRHCRIEETLDLHGDPEITARQRLQTFLSQSVRSGRRCVLIVHGKGIHSDGYSVLRNMVIDQLAVPLSGWVHGACTAEKRDGADGATMVMLRTRATAAAAGRAVKKGSSPLSTMAVSPSPVPTPALPLRVSASAAAQAATSMSPLSSALVAALRVDTKNK